LLLYSFDKAFASDGKGFAPEAVPFLSIGFQLSINPRICVPDGNALDR
jgi:hypothetical protein